MTSYCTYDGGGCCGAYLMYAHRLDKPCLGPCRCYFNKDVEETIWWVVFEHDGEMLIEDLVKCFKDEQLVWVYLKAFETRFFIKDDKIYSWRRWLNGSQVAYLIELFGDKTHKHIELLK